MHKHKQLQGLIRLFVRSSIHRLSSGVMSRCGGVWSQIPGHVGAPHVAPPRRMTQRAQRLTDYWSLIDVPQLRLVSALALTRTPRQRMVSAFVLFFSFCREETWHEDQLFFLSLSPDRLFTHNLAHLFSAEEESENPIWWTILNINSSSSGNISYG